jgi:hypothetical protein
MGRAQEITPLQQILDRNEAWFLPIDHLTVGSAAAGRRGRARAWCERRGGRTACEIMPEFSPNCPLSFRDPSSHRMVLVGDDSFIGGASFVEMTLSIGSATFPAWLVAADLKRETGPRRPCG